MNLIFLRLFELLQKFSVLFSVDTSINRKNIRFISYQLIFISFQQRNRSFLLINGFFYDGRRRAICDVTIQLMQKSP